MGFDVDKTRRHREAFGIDNALRVASQRPTDRSDAARGESDIADGARAAAAVKEDPTTD
jgi:hypothetical protein